MFLSQKDIKNVVWWSESIMDSENDIDKKISSGIIYFVASNSGWGATSENNQIRGPFSLEENKYYISAK